MQRRQEGFVSTPPMPRRLAKAHLPSKICPVCQRPFSWRRKWAKDWAQVRYCSERCRRGRTGADLSGAPDKGCAKSG